MKGRFAGEPSISGEVRRDQRLSYRCSPWTRQVQPSRRNIRTPSIRTNKRVTPHLSHVVSSLRESSSASCGISQPGQFNNSRRDDVRGDNSKDGLNEQPRWLHCRRDPARSDCPTPRKSGLGSHRDKSESSRNCCRQGFQAPTLCS